MSLLNNLTTLINQLNVPVETGVFSDEAPEQYIVLIPVTSNYDLYADNLPTIDVEEVRISIYSKTNYLNLKRRIERLILSNELTITDRRYNGFEKESKYHHYNLWQFLLVQYPYTYHTIHSILSM